MSGDTPDMFAVRPDRKGPKTVAILLLLGGIFFAILGYADFSNHLKHSRIARLRH